MSWTDDQRRRLKDLRAEGHSFSVICRVLGKTRNACIGEADRRGYRPAGGKAAPPQLISPLSSCRPQQPDRPKAPAPVKKKERRAPSQSSYLNGAAASPVRLHGGKRVTLMDLNDDMCRRPFGDPLDRDFHFCGQDRRRDPQTGKANSPYCEGHSSHGTEGCYRDPVGWENALKRVNL